MGHWCILGKFLLYVHTFKVIPGLSELEVQYILECKGIETTGYQWTTVPGCSWCE